jgi:hypothetical protein
MSNFTQLHFILNYKKQNVCRNVNFCTEFQFAFFFFYISTWRERHFSPHYYYLSRQCPDSCVNVVVIISSLQFL